MIETYEGLADAMPLGDRFVRGFGRLQGKLGACQLFSLAFKLINFVLLTPLAAGLIRLMLSHWGKASVGNFEILAFAATPAGLAGLAGVGLVALVSFYLEIAGLTWLLDTPEPSWWRPFPVLAARLKRLAELGTLQLLVLAGLFLPFLGGVALVYARLWSGRDIYGLLILRPPVFWLGAGLAGLLVLIATALALVLVFRWLFAVPALLFEPGVSALGALQLSDARTAGRLRVIAGLLAVWFVGQTVLSALVLGTVHLLAGWLLDEVGPSLRVALPATAAVLVVEGAVSTVLTIVGNLGLAALALELYRGVVPRPPVAESDVPPSARLATKSDRRGVVIRLLVLVLVTALLCPTLLLGLRLEDRVEITAHRGASAVAPENTVASIRKAIEMEADWAEIDVQLTADGALVVTHDTDLARMGGGNRQVGEATLAEVRALDVGRRFGPEFAGEKIPTLEEVIAAAGDQIRLTIELKPHKERDVADLVDAVIAAVRKANYVGRCRLCSQSYTAMQRAKAAEPRLDVGFIAGAAIGDLSALEVQYLMVNARLVNRRLVDRAALRGISVHAWTVKNPDELPGLLDAGVGNVITDDPARIRARLDEIRALSTGERLLLRARAALVR